MDNFQYKEVLVSDLRFLLHALETLDAEVEQLEATEDWYSSDSRDVLDAALQFLRGILGIQEIEYDEDGEEIHQSSFTLYD